MPIRNSNIERDRAEAQLRKAYIDAIARIVSGVTISSIESESVEHIMRQLDIDNASFRDVLDKLEAAYAKGGDGVAKAAGVAFDPRAGASAIWLRAKGAELVTRINAQQREAISAILTSGVELGRSPKQIALDIVGRRARIGRRKGGIIGLAENQAQAVANARRNLVNGEFSSYLNRKQRSKQFDSMVLSAKRDGKKLSAKAIDRITGAYADNLLVLRGETIAQTETLAAYNAGREQVWQQAVDKGKADQSEVVRVWRAVNDSATRDAHADMDGQERGIDEPFTDGDGYELMFPGDTSLGAPASTTINCRCMLSIFKRPLGVRHGAA